MKTTQKCFVLFLGVWGLTAFPAAATECSTEKVNKSCTVTIDRNYPVTPPTIQMGKGEKVQVVVDHALPFETVTLDLQSAQTIAGTDQTQAIVTGGLAQAKSLVFKAASLVGPGAPATVHPPELVRLDNDLGRLVQSVESFGSNATKLYLELQEAVGTIPPQTLATGKRPQESPLLTFPAPPVPVAANFLGR